MNIGIIGSGDIGGNLGKLWSRAGHKVLFSSRHPERLNTLVEEAGDGARAGTVAEAAAFGDAVFFAVNFWTADEAVAAAGPMNGKIVIDATNAYKWSEAGGLVRALPEDTTAATELAKKLPGAKVVKAYSALPATALVNGAHRSDAKRIAVFYCGNDASAKAVVAGLIADSGFAPLDAGLLSDAADVEIPGPLASKALRYEEARKLLASIR